MIDHHWDAIACDYVLTEMGGWPHGGGTRVGVTVGEKGLAQRRLTVRGTPGHGSMPYRTDNAILKAAEVVRRLGQYQPRARLDEMWAARVMAAGLPTDVQQGLLDPARLEDTLAALPPAAARMLHACSHTTISCNVVHGGVKTNVIPDRVEIELDIRTLPGDGPDEVMAYLREALGELADEVEVEPIRNDLASISPLGTPMYEVLERRTQMAYPGASLLPELLVGATDNRHFRRKGVVAYGTGLLSSSVRFEQFAARFHGNDERIDLESLGLATDYWVGVATDMVG